MDYVAKICLACPAAPTQTARDVLTALEIGIAEAEALLGKSLALDKLDPETGEISPLTIVTDNGPAYKSDAFARFVGRQPHLRHVRMRYRSSQSNGVIERFNKSMNYEHLYCREIPADFELIEELAVHRRVYNEIHPHEHLGFLTPMEVYLADPTGPLPKGWEPCWRSPVPPPRSSWRGTPTPTRHCVS